MAESGCEKLYRLICERAVGGDLIGRQARAQAPRSNFHGVSAESHRVTVLRGKALHKY